MRLEMIYVMFLCVLFVTGMLRHAVFSTFVHSGSCQNCNRLSSSWRLAVTREACDHSKHVVEFHIEE